jgi:replicative DNA helicase
MSDVKQAGTYDVQFGREFQKHVLEVALRIPSFIPRYRAALDPAYFVSDLHYTIAKALFQHHDEYGSLPGRALMTELVREIADDEKMLDLEALLENMYKADVSDAEAVMDKAINFGRHQAMINAIIEGADMLERGDRNVMPLIQDALAVGEDLTDLGLEYADTESSRYDYYLQGEHIGETVPTGLVHLDRALRGGLGRGELGVILAPPKRGKTTLLINFGFGALLALWGYNVVYYTCEMSQDKIGRRFDDRIAGGRVGWKYTNPKKYIELLKQRTKAFVNGRLFVKGYSTRRASVSTLRSHLSILAANSFRPDLVIVDYADILKPDRRLGEMRHEQAGIYEDLRALAQEFDCALWTASQTNRQGASKEVVTITDFGESFEKAAIADTVIALCQSPDEKADDLCRIFFAALRSYGDGRTVDCEIKRDRCSIKSVALLDPTGKAILSKAEEAEGLQTRRPEGDLQKRMKKEGRVLSEKKAGGRKRKKKAKKVSKKVKKVADIRDSDDEG